MYRKSSRGTKVHKVAISTIVCHKCNESAAIMHRYVLKLHQKCIKVYQTVLQNVLKSTQNVICYFCPTSQAFSTPNNHFKTEMYAFPIPLPSSFVHVKWGSFFSLVPPDKPKIFDERGQEVRLKLGPYRIGDTVALKCTAYGGEFVKDGRGWLRILQSQILKKTCSS